MVGVGVSPVVVRAQVVPCLVRVRKVGETVCVHYREGVLLKPCCGFLHGIPGAACKTERRAEEGILFFVSTYPFCCLCAFCFSLLPPYMQSRSPRTELQVTAIGGWTVTGQQGGRLFSPLPTTVCAPHFYRDKTSAISSPVDCHLNGFGLGGG